MITVCVNIKSSLCLQKFIVLFSERKSIFRMKMLFVEMSQFIVLMFSISMTWAANILPILDVPMSITANQDSETEITSFRVQDFDADSVFGYKMFVNISCANGKLSLRSMNGIYLQQGNIVGDTSMKFSGSLQKVQLSLSTVSYKPRLGFVGVDTIVTSVVDSHMNLGYLVYDHPPVRMNTTVSVNPKFNPPYISIPLSLDGSEGVQLRFSASIVARSLLSKSSISIYAGNGNITLGVCVLSQICELSGSIADINAALTTVLYDPKPGFNFLVGGMDTVTISVKYQKPEASGLVEEVVAKTVIRLQPQPYSPLLTLPPYPGAFAISIKEDTVLVLGTSDGTSVNADVRLSVVDPNPSAMVDLNVTASVGSFEVAIPSSAYNSTPVALTDTLTDALGQLVVLKASDSFLSVRGSVRWVNAALKSLTYIPKAEYGGAVDVQITVVHTASASAILDHSQTVQAVRGRVAVTVIPVDDPPSVYIPTPRVWSDEDVVLVLPLSPSTFSDVDAHPTGLVRVTVSSVGGLLSFLGWDANKQPISSNQVRVISYASAASTDGRIGVPGSSSIVVLGTIADLNNLFASNLTFTPDPNLNIGSGRFAEVSILAEQFDIVANVPVSDASSASLRVFLRAVNDAPTVTAPAFLTGLEDIPLPLLNFSITDDDANEYDGLLTVNVSLFFGRLAVKNMVGLHVLSIPGMKTSEGAFLTTLRCSLAVCNAALASALFIPNENWSGEDFLEMSVSDSPDGVPSLAYPLQSVRTTLRVSAVNDAPSLALPARLVLREDADPTVVPNVGVTDVDFFTDPVNNAYVSVSVAARVGQVSMTGDQVMWGADPYEPTDSDVKEGEFGRIVYITGPIYSVNKALGRLLYKAPLNFNGLDAIAVTASDNGHYNGALAQVAPYAPPLITQGSVPIAVLPVDDPLVLTPSFLLFQPDGSGPPVLDPKPSSPFASLLAAGPSLPSSQSSLSSSPSSSFASTSSASLSVTAHMPRLVDVHITDEDAGPNDLHVLTLLCATCEFRAAVDALPVTRLHSLDPKEVPSGTGSAAVSLVGTLSSLNKALQRTSYVSLLSPGGTDFLAVSVRQARRDLSFSTMDATQAAALNITVTVSGRTLVPTLTAVGRTVWLAEGEASKQILAPDPCPTLTCAPVLSLQYDPVVASSACIITLSWSDGLLLTTDSAVLGVGTAELLAETLSVGSNTGALGVGMDVGISSAGTLPSSRTVRTSCSSVTPLLQTARLSSPTSANSMTSPNLKVNITVTVPLTVNSDMDGADTAVVTVVLPVYVKPVNNAPVIAISSGIGFALQGVEDTAISLRPLSIADQDVADGSAAGPRVELNVTVLGPHGILGFPPQLLAPPASAGLPIVYTMNNTGTFYRVRGSLSEVNRALMLLAFTPSADWSGDESLLIEVGDLDPIAPLHSAQMLTVQVVAVDDPPVLHLNNTNNIVHVFEDIASTPFVEVDIQDIDTPGDLSLTVSASHGLVGFTGGLGQSVTIRGSCVDIRRALSEMQYLSPPGANIGSIGIVTVTFAASDRHDALHDRPSVLNVSVWVDAVTDPPTLHLPTPALIATSVRTAVSVAASASPSVTIETVPIGVSGVSVGAESGSLVTVTVTLVEQEELRFDNSAQTLGKGSLLHDPSLATLTVVSDTVGNLTVVGRTNAVNVWLSTLSYRPYTFFWIGRATVSLLIAAVDGSGTSGGSVSGSVDVLVEKAPALSGAIVAIGGRSVTVEDTSIITPNFLLAAFVPTELIDVVIECFSNSSRSQSSSAQSVATHDIFIDPQHLSPSTVIDSTQPALLKISGTQDGVNDALQGLVVTPAPAFVGLITVSATVAGKAGGASRAMTFVLVKAINNPPSVQLVATSPNCTSSEPCILNLTLFDPDATDDFCQGGNAFVVTLSLPIAATGSSLSLLLPPEARRGLQLLPSAQDKAPSASQTTVLKFRCSTVLYSGASLQLVFTPAPGWFGNLSVTAVVSDEGSCGGSLLADGSYSADAIALTAFASASLVITRGASPPQLYFSDSKGETTHSWCVEDTQCQLPPLWIAPNTEDNLYRLTLAVSHGSLLPADLSRFTTMYDGAVAVVAQNRTSIVVASRSSAALTALASGLTYLPDPNYNCLWTLDGAPVGKGAVSTDSAATLLWASRVGMSTGSDIDQTQPLESLQVTLTAWASGASPDSSDLVLDGVVSATSLLTLHLSILPVNDAPAVRLQDSAVIVLSAAQATRSLRVLKTVRIHDADCEPIVNSSSSLVMETISLAQRPLPPPDTQSHGFFSCPVQVVVSSTSGVFWLTLADSLRSGVAFNQSNINPSSQMSLSGSLSQVQTALQLVNYRYHTLVSSSDVVTVLLSDLGSFGYGSIQSDRASLTVQVLASSWRGYSLLASGGGSDSSGGSDALSVGDTAAVEVGASLTISPEVIDGRTPRTMQSVVTTAHSRGELVSTSVSVDELAPTSARLKRVFQLDVQGHATVLPEVQKLMIEVPWRYERQLLQFTFPNNVFPSESDSLSAAGSVSLSLNQYGLEEKTSFFIGSSPSIAADNLVEALSGLRNVGRVEVSFQTGAVSVDNTGIHDTIADTVYGQSNVSLSLTVTFLTNSGNVPLLSVSAAGNPDMNKITVTELAAGSLIAEEQTIVVTCAAVLPSSCTGSFAVALIHSYDYQHLVSQSQLNGLRAETTELLSAVIPVTATADQVYSALSQLSYIGLIHVTQTATGLAVGGKLQWSWQVRFETYGGDIPMLVALSSLGPSDPNFVRTKGCNLCTPLSSAVMSISVVEQVKGTQPIGGNFRLGFGSEDRDALPSSDSQQIPFHATSEGMSAALLTLPGVTSAKASVLTCASEYQCQWMLYIWHASGRLPLLTVLTSELQGFGVRAYTTRHSAGTKPAVGQYKLQLQSAPSPAEPSSMKMTTDWLPLNATTAAITSALQTAVGDNVHVSVSQENAVTTVDSSQGLSYTRTLITLSLAALDSDISIAGPKKAWESSAGIGNGLVSLQWREEVPVATLIEKDIQGTNVAMSLEEVDSGLTEPHARFLLSLNYPTVYPKSEVQRVSCSSVATLPASELFEDVANPELVNISFRTYVTTGIWIHSFVDPSFLPYCSAAGVMSGSPCKGDGKTVLERLRALPSVAGLTMLHTNSTSGRLCPTAADVTAAKAAVLAATNSSALAKKTRVVFSTQFRFDQSSVGQTAGSSTADFISGSDGDVPSMLLLGQNLTSPATGYSSSTTKTSIKITEVVPGSKPFVREIQTLHLIRYGNMSSQPTRFRLQYESISNFAILATTASADDVAAAVSRLVGDSVSVSRSGYGDLGTPNAICSPLAPCNDGLGGYVWTITFPERFGRAFLLQVPNIIDNDDFTTFSPWAADFWREKPVCSFTEGQVLNNVASSQIRTCVQVTSRRLVSGFSTLTGSLTIGASKPHALNPLAVSFTASAILGTSVATANKLTVACRANAGFEKANVYPIAPLPSTPESELFVLDLGVGRATQGLANVQIETTKSLSRNFPMCAIVTHGHNDKLVTQDKSWTPESASLELPCHFPFRHQGIEFSACVGIVQPVCSTVYDMDSQGSLYGSCVPCSSSISSSTTTSSSLSLPVATLTPLEHTLRWTGSPVQVASALRGVVYVPFPNMPRIDGLAVVPTYANDVVNDVITVLLMDNVTQTSYTISGPSGVSFPVAEDLTVPVVIDLTNDPPGLENFPLPLVSPGAAPNSAVFASTSTPAYFVFENTKSLMDGLRVVDPDYPTNQAQRVGKVGVSLAVQNGDLYLAHTSDLSLSFSVINITGNMSFAGSIADVNAALASLVYVPNQNWNSASTGVTPSVLRVSLKAPPHREEQLISTIVSGNGMVLHIATSYFKLQMDCLDYAKALMATNTGAPQWATKTTSVVVSNPIGADASASFVQTEINALLKQCAVMSTIWRVTRSLTSNTRNVSAIVTRFSTDGEDLHDNKGCYRWSVHYLSPATMPLFSFPKLQVASSNILVTSTSGSGSVVVESMHTGITSPRGLFRLRLGSPSSSASLLSSNGVGDWTPFINIGDSGRVVRDALVSISGVNDVDVELSIVRSKLGEVIEYNYDVIFLHDRAWIPDLTRLSTQVNWSTRYAFGPMDALEVDVIPDPAAPAAISTWAEVDVREVGSATPDTLSVLLVDFSSGKYDSAATASSTTIPIFVLPVWSMPAVAQRQDTVVTAENTRVLLEQLFTLQADRHDASYYSTSIATLLVVAQFGSVLLPTSLVSDSASLVSDSDVRNDVQVIRSSTGVNSNRTLELSGSVTALNQSLSLLVFQPDQNFFGAASLWVGLSFDGAHYSTAFLKINVTNIENLPILSAPSPFMLAQTGVSIALAAVSIVDLDDIDSSCLYSITISVSPISQSLSAVSAGSSSTLIVPVLAEATALEFVPVDWRSYTGEKVTLQGSRAALNLVLQYIRYRHAITDNTTVSESITITAIKSEPLNSSSASTGNLTFSQNITVSVVQQQWHTGGAPIAIVPPTSALSVQEDQTLIGLAGLIIEPANGAANVSIDLFVSSERGVLFLPESYTQPGKSTPRISVFSSGSVLHIQGFAVDVSGAIGDIRFTPPPDYSGSVMLTLTVLLCAEGPCQLPDSTTSESRSREQLMFTSYSASIVSQSPTLLSSEVLVFVEPVDDPPVITTRSNRLFLLQTTPVDSSVPLLLFDAADIDDAFYLKVSLSVTAGQLDMTTTASDPLLALVHHSAGPPLLVGATVTFFAISSDITRALDHIVYKPYAYYSGTENISLAVSSLCPVDTSVSSRPLAAATTHFATATNFGYTECQTSSLFVPLNVRMPSNVIFSCPSGTYILPLPCCTPHSATTALFFFFLFFSLTTFLLFSPINDERTYDQRTDSFAN